MDLIDHQQQLTRELQPGERLLWSGEPRQGLIFRASDALLVPFSMLWAGFAFYWEFIAIKSRAPLLFKLWGIPFVLVGLYIVAGRFFWDALTRQTMIYAVTDRRVIIVSNFPRRNVRSIPLTTIPEVSISESNDGSGTIVLGAPALYGALPQNSWTSRSNRPPMLEGIQRVRSVYDTICEAQKNALPAFSRQ